MEEKLRTKDTLIEKLRLKNSTTKAQISKLEQQLAHKEEMGEVLHLGDFDQLKIENPQYMEKIEERNNELLRLKLSTSRTVQVRERERGKRWEGGGGADVWLSASVIDPHLNRVEVRGGRAVCVAVYM